MAVIKVQDIAYGRLRAPDLDVMEEFLTDFGMIRAERTRTALYMRGTGPAHHIHVTEKGPASFVGLGYYAASLDDLKTLAKRPGASGIETLDEPGGGKRVRLTEPNGFQIEVLYGLKKVKPITVKRQELNSAKAPLQRAGELMRLPFGPARPLRIGHAAIATPKVKETVRWFRDTFGLICSAEVYDGRKTNIVNSFNRVDRGKDYVDHHMFVCFHNKKQAGLNHLAYEVQDVDDVIVGHEYMSTRHKYKHIWGIGRHVLGSQVFDYWADPWGRVHEHWTDVDRINTRTKPDLLPVKLALDSQWGDRLPPIMRDRVRA
jgi:Glyoxalase/Bleomycin resistance protein/Dioxygenase superfamily